MRIELDRDCCVGHNRCVVLAPDLFDADEDGYAILKRDPQTDEEKALAQRAVRACPERAITIIEE